jgi:hypothetical protein
MVTIIDQREIADLRKELAALSREVGVDTDRRIVVINGGEPAFRGARYCATFLYPGYRWTRTSLDGESKSDFYRRVLLEAGERGGVLTICGGIPPEPRDDDCDPAWNPI